MKKREISFSIGSGGAAAFALAVFFLDTEMLLCLAVCIFVHEAGHLAAMMALGVSVQSVRAEASGLNIVCGDAPYIAELFCALAGPFFGAAAAFIFARAGLTELSGISALLTAFNLLPASPLDGGRALNSALRLFLMPDAADKVSLIAGTAVSVCIIFAAVRRRLGILPIIFALWLLYGYCKKPSDGVK